MAVMASRITSLTIVYSTIYSGEDQRKHQSSASLGFVQGIHRWPVNFQHKGPVTQKMFPFDEVIMCRETIGNYVYLIFEGVCFFDVFESINHCIQKSFLDRKA